MFRLGYVTLSLLLLGDIFSMQFDSIVRSYARDPAKMIEELRTIENESEEAKAFLQNFGGDNFQKEDGVERHYSEQVMDRVKEAAFTVGSEMRKIGASQVDNVEALSVGKRFLEFADMGTAYHLVDQDVSGSLWSEQLDAMISDRQRYKNSVQDLKGELIKKKKEGVEAARSVLLSKDLLGEL